MKFKLSGHEHVVFYAMTILTIIALGATAVFHKQTTESMVEIADSNRTWNHFLDLLSKLEWDAGEVNAPGNDVFRSHDVKMERTRFHMLQSQFDRDLGALRQSFMSAPPDLDRSGDQKLLMEIEATEARMARSTEIIFE